MIRVSSSRPITALSCSVTPGISLVLSCPPVWRVLPRLSSSTKAASSVIRCLSFGLNLVALVRLFWFGMTRHGKDIMALTSTILHYCLLLAYSNPLRRSPKPCSFQGSGEVLGRMEAFSKSRRGTSVGSTVRSMADMSVKNEMDVYVLGTPQPRLQYRGGYYHM